MSKDYIAQIAAESLRVFGEDSLEGVVLSHFYGLLHRLGANFSGITLGEVASDLNWYSSHEHRKAIASAFDYLASRYPPLLVRQYQLWDQRKEEILDQPLWVFSDEDIREALETNELINPLTGESVPSFLDWVTVIYVLSEEIKKELLANGGRK